MTAEELEAIRERCDKATPKPWVAVAEWQRTTGPAAVVYVLRKIMAATHIITASDSMSANDADFIAHAREDVPALLDEVERLQAVCRTEHDERVRLAEYIRLAQHALIGDGKE